MEIVTIKSFEEIRAFLENKYNSPISEYNSFITMESFPGWVSRPFHVYHFDDIVDGDKIVDWMIHIASVQNLPVKHGVVEFVKLYNEKAVYRINVKEIEKIDLKEILK